MPASPETDDAVPLEIVGCRRAPGIRPPRRRPGARANQLLPGAECGSGELRDDLDYHSNAPETWYNFDFYEGAWTNAFKAGAGTLTSITSYFHQEANNRTQLVPLDISPFTARNYDALPSEVREQYHQAAQELRFESKAGERVDYMVGAFYRQARWRNTSSTDSSSFPSAPSVRPPFNGPPFNIVTNPTQAHRCALIRTSDKTYSAFATTTVKLTDQLSLDLGAHTRIEKTGSRSLTFGTSVNNQFAFRAVSRCQPDRRMRDPGLRQLRLQPAGPREPHQHRSYKISDSDFAVGGPAVQVQRRRHGLCEVHHGFKAGGFSGAATSNVFGPSMPMEWA
jgi:hypothetical protein